MEAQKQSLLPDSPHANIQWCARLRAFGSEKENVHLSEQYFDVIDSKTENGIRKVPIADKVLPFYQRWLHDCSDCEYLIHTLDSQHFTYYMYYHNVFQPLMFRLHIDHTPHCCRHTTISLLAEAHVDQTTIKKLSVIPALCP